MMTKSVVLLMVIFIVASVQCESSSTLTFFSELLKIENSTLLSFSNLLLDPVVLYNEDGTKIIANVTLPQDAPNSLKIYNVKPRITCDYTNLTTVFNEYRAKAFGSNIAITARRTRSDSKTRFSKPGDIWELIILNPKTCNKVVSEIKVKSPLYITWVLLDVGRRPDNLILDVALKHPKFENITNGHYVERRQVNDYLGNELHYLHSAKRGEVLSSDLYPLDPIDVSEQYLRKYLGSKIFDENNQKFLWAQPLNFTTTILHDNFSYPPEQYLLHHATTINFNITTFCNINALAFAFCYGDTVNSKIITCNQFIGVDSIYSKVINLEHNLKTVLVTTGPENFHLLIWVESSQEQDYYIKAVAIRNEGVFGKVEQLLHTKKEITKINYSSAELYDKEKDHVFNTNCFSATLRNGSHYDVINHCF